MNAVFADTYFFLALLNKREAQHRSSVDISKDPHVNLVTTEWVLAEFGDAYSAPQDRSDFAEMYRTLATNPRVKIVPADTQLFQRGVDFFERRPDKNWTLTDCISFVVMQDEEIREALTADRHFEQAGYIALLKH